MKDSHKWWERNILDGADWQREIIKASQTLDSLLLVQVIQK
jgi:hypothetical protein